MGEAVTGGRRRPRGPDDRNARALDEQRVGQGEVSSLETVVLLDLNPTTGDEPGCAPVIVSGMAITTAAGAGLS
jgi:hypothetical protein